MEIIEVAKQISSGLDIGYIIKNVNFVMISKYRSVFTAFILPYDIDDLSPAFHLYKGISREKYDLKFKSIITLIDFFEKQECNQISFSQFALIFPDKIVLKEIGIINPEFIIPLRSDKGIIGVYLQGKREDGKSYSMDDIQFIINIIGFATISIENANLYRQATVDRMTKLYTHHQFQKRLEEEIKKGHRYNHKFSLIMFDIDHFKKINDKYGHLQGDLIIKVIARIFTESIREVDFPSRYGGEEFIAILPESDAKTAAKVAERLRKLIENFQFPDEKGNFLNVTISMGVMDFNPEYVKYNENIIESVDAALYFSKQNGRNRISYGNYTGSPTPYKSS
jgi:diguanylate cyclase (GGDEF)-like protein